MHRVAFAALLGLTVICSGFSAYAQEGGRHEVLRAKDGFPIHITYYPFVESKDAPGATAMNAPVVVLLPGDKENRLLWDKSSSPRDQDPFPILLQKRGYVVISVDPRKHGESMINPDDRVQPNDYSAMALADMGAVKDFIYAEHQAQRLNMQRMAIVGSGTGAAVAAAFAEFDWSRPPYDDAPLPAERTPRGQDVKVLILISPESTAGRIKTSSALRPLRGPAINLGLQVIVGADDNADKRQAAGIYDSFVTANKGGAENTRVVLLKPELKDRGISMMRQKVPYGYAFKFLEDNLKTMDIPWQDRRSRLER
ncbi:hypothetical protein SH661x_004675 [Planctomicrobium sp. SH661]|uniref:hypothetical protein n=1 Tax=Planctomicrobium sp. SH661 TaxID=3448124 RepID=UPI003F5BA716